MYLLLRILWKVLDDIGQRNFNFVRLAINSVFHVSILIICSWSPSSCFLSSVSTQPENTFITGPHWSPLWNSWALPILDPLTCCTHKCHRCDLHSRLSITIFKSHIIENLLNQMVMETISTIRNPTYNSDFSIKDYFMFFLF